MIHQFGFDEGCGRYQVSRQPVSEFDESCGRYEPRSGLQNDHNSRRTVEPLHDPRHSDHKSG